MGHEVYDNLVEQGFKGDIYPINPNVSRVHEHETYPSVLDVPGQVDLAVVAIPARFVPGVMRECGEKGVDAVVVISAGFKETGAEGARLESELVDIAWEYGMRLLGPNVLGVINTYNGLNATFAKTIPHQGNISFMTQSGALATVILDWAEAEDIGFAKFVSLGNKADMDEVDLLKSWKDDPETDVILIYMEGIGEGREFMRAARAASREKPVVALKAGESSAGKRAVASHTGTIAGSKQAYDAAFEQSRVVRAETTEDLLTHAVAFSEQPIPHGRGVAVVTNAGGLGIMATDAVERYDLHLASLSSDTVEVLQEELPPAANIYNPVDVLGDAGADRYSLALKAVLDDPNVDAAITILTPQAMTKVRETARTVARISSGVDKPVLASFMGGVDVAPGIEVLRERGVPNYEYPEAAAKALATMNEYRESQVVPEMRPPRFDVDRERATRIMGEARGEGRTLLGETEARGIIDAYGIPTPRTAIARTADEAAGFAGEVGYPVVLKVASPDVVHKTDVGGVKLGLESSEDVRRGFDQITSSVRRQLPDAEIWGVEVQEQVEAGRETLVGMTRDVQFGPLLVFGLGGIYVEVLRDVSYRIAPITKREAGEMIREIRSYPLLRGVRGRPPADTDAVVDVILRVSQMVMDFPRILELDLNPLVVRERGRGCRRWTCV